MKNAMKKYLHNRYNCIVRLRNARLRCLIAKRTVREGTPGRVLGHRREQNGEFVLLIKFNGVKWPLVVSAAHVTDIDITMRGE